MSASDCDVLVIGAGISGLVTAKVLQESGFRVTVLERTGEVGGLWTYREHDYGVMRFTHINVSKHNYRFSDFPFKDDVPDYPHNKHMAQYIVDYVIHNRLEECIRFFMKVTYMEQIEDGWRVKAVRVEDDGKCGIVTNEEEVLHAKYVAVATGHHAKPIWPKFRGEKTFPGEISHGVKYKDAVTNCIVGKRVLVVGIGNSAVDVAVDATTTGRCSTVYLSTRSGAWVVPNYVFGRPLDLYACRAVLAFPWTFTTRLFETIIRLISGHPNRWKLNPKVHALQSQPTISASLVNHIQRGDINIVPNIQYIEGSTVHFIDGQSAEFDHIFYCTGYSIDLPFLPDDICDKVLNKDANSINLYKNVFSPDIGSSLAFIGFVQEASGSILSMSETQAMWFSELCKKHIQLPKESEMISSIDQEKESISNRYFRSASHTILRDSIVYNDDIASNFGAKPELWRYPWLAWKLLVGSGGAAQWRLQGPHKWTGAEAAVRKVPVTEMMHYGGIIVLLLLVYLFLRISCLFLSIF